MRDRGFPPRNRRRGFQPQCHAIGHLLLTLSLLTSCDSQPPAPPPPPPKNDPLTVRITGQEFEWHVLYPGADGALDTSDDIRDKRHLHLPANTPITIDFRSNDYVYSLYFPHVDLLEITVPQQLFTMEFVTESPGKFDLLGTQMCGYTHPNLIGNLVVHAPDDFDAWLKRRSHGVARSDVAASRVSPQSPSQPKGADSQPNKRSASDEAAPQVKKGATGAEPPKK